MPCEHDLDPEYLYPSDARIVAITEGAAGDTTFTILLPCPECDDAIEVTAAITDADEADVELPLEDVEDYHD